METNIRVISAIVLVFIACSLLVMPVALAELPKPQDYIVGSDRTTRDSHKGALVVVSELTLKGTTTYKLLFMPTRGGYENQPFQCDKALANNSDHSLSCEVELEAEKDGTKYQVRETLTIGALKEDSGFCCTLRQKHETKYPKAVMKKDDCQATYGCMCYELKHECWNKIKNKYEKDCPDFDGKTKNAKGKLKIFAAPGRGAGSGGSN